MQASGRRLGRLAWRVSRRDRERVLDHLGIAFPDLDASARRHLAHANFEHYGTMLAEAFWLRHRGEVDLRRIVAFEGWEHIEAERAAGRPVLVLSAHLGNWEMLAASLNVRGLRMAVVARELDEELLQSLLVGLRDRFGTRTIVRGAPGAPRALLGALRSGGALGMLIDQDTKVEGVFVPFFGRPAYTPVGAAQLAQRFGAAVLPGFIERRDDGTHRVQIDPPMELPDDPVEATARMTATIEARIRRTPEQWVWLHRRWRRRPDQTGASSPVANVGPASTSRTGAT